MGKVSKVIYRITIFVFQRKYLFVDQHTSKLGDIGDQLHPLSEARQQLLVVCFLRTGRERGRGGKL